MKGRQLPIYALALAVLLVGLAALGVPLSGVVIVLLALACPLMMFIMMRAMSDGGGHGRGGRPSDSPDRHHDEHPASGRH